MGEKASALWKKHGKRWPGNQVGRAGCWGRKAVIVIVGIVYAHKKEISIQFYS